MTQSIEVHGVRVFIADALGPPLQSAQDALDLVVAALEGNAKLKITLASDARAA